MASEIKVNTIKDLGGNTIVSSNGSGTITGLPASAISSGTVATARLGSGTASSSTFLAGDSSYKTVSGTTINNNADNRVITGSGTANTLEGEANLNFDGSTLGVGISTTNAQAKVHIMKTDVGALNDGNSDDLMIEGSNTGICIGSATNGEGHIYFSDSGDADVGAISYFHGSNYMAFRSNATERLRIKQYDFCVGTTSPISTNGITFKAGTTSGDDWISSYRTTASTPHYIHAFYSDAGGTQTAKYAVYADGTASAISDVNYKKNITDARNYLEDLEKIDVIKYNLKTDNEGEFKKLGFSAQQVETIFPNMIDADNTPLKEFYEEGDEIPEDKAIGDIKKTTAREVKLLKKEVFVPMLVKAVQELSAKIKTLETENTDIKARLTALENA